MLNVLQITKLITIFVSTINNNNLRNLQHEGKLDKKMENIIKQIKKFALYKGANPKYMITSFQRHGYLVVYEREFQEWLKTTRNVSGTYKIVAFDTHNGYGYCFVAGLMYLCESTRNYNRIVVTRKVTNEDRKDFIRERRENPEYFK